MEGDTCGRCWHQDRDGCLHIPLLQPLCCLPAFAGQLWNQALIGHPACQIGSWCYTMQALPEQYADTLSWSGFNSRICQKLCHSFLSTSKYATVSHQDRGCCLLLVGKRLASSHSSMQFRQAVFKSNRKIRSGVHR